MNFFTFRFYKKTMIDKNDRRHAMKTIGLIGGMSWESTVTYYKVINETIKRELGGLHSAKILLYSVDFDEIEKYQASGEWDKSKRTGTNFFYGIWDGYFPHGPVVICILPVFPSGLPVVLSCF